MEFKEIPEPQEYTARRAPLTRVLDALPRGRWHLAEAGVHYPLPSPDPTWAMAEMEAYRAKLYNYAKPRGLKCETRKMGDHLAFIFTKAS